MPARPLVMYPDARLRLKALPVGVVDAAVRQLAADIVETMRAVAAVGLTACHVGEFRRVVVIRLDPAAPPQIHIDPAITWTSGETAVHTEGSVSMPGVNEEIERPARIRLTWRDLDDVAHEAEADGFLAACLQHEIDQLDGIFWIERLSRLKRERVIKRFDKLRRQQRG
ncbi:peptide deformylase [Phreatobacter sp. AB_2022a]|uniref:peptide deformylase n=1 Tax=Phreatobacter sp. AB_2022a TaxID=3003134 RepID=UPI0022871117|nr:peptide deformylase [Phreatobacter sp. AB_2022a]MCZ0738533.1 peptide deformylase [Phreatobacter sp. AB_2022a]